MNEKSSVTEVKSNSLLESARLLKEWCMKDEGYNHDTETMKALEEAGYISSLLIREGFVDSYNFFMTEKLKAL